MSQYATHMRSMPTGTVLYTFDSGLAEAFPQEMTFPSAINNERLRSILERKPLNIYAKTGANVWVDLVQMTRFYYNVVKVNLLKNIVASFPNVTIVNSMIPECVYTDANYIGYRIAPHDGATLDLTRNSRIYIDPAVDVVKNWGSFDTYAKTFVITNYHPQQRTDLRITDLPGKSLINGDFMISVNGFFKRGYYVTPPNNGEPYLAVTNVVQHSLFYNNLLNTGVNYLEHKIQLFKWDGVSVGYNMLIGKDMFTKYYYNSGSTTRRELKYPARLTFAKEWTDKMLLVIDGKIIGNSWYKVLPSNPRILDISRLVEDVLMRYETAYSDAGIPLDIYTVSRLLDFEVFTYELVSKVSTKEIVVYRDSNIIFNKPERGAFSFDDVYAEDGLLLVNGHSRNDVVSVGGGAFKFLSVTDIETMFPRLTDVSQIDNSPYQYEYDMNGVTTSVFREFESIRIFNKPKV